MNCNQISFEIKAGGLILNAEIGVGSRPSTIAIGAGFQQGIPMIGKAGIKEQYFISFDGNNHVSDLGVQEIVRVKAPGVNETAGWKLGVNSGWNFQEGPLKPIADKLFGIAETQVNHNVNLYKKN